MKSVLGSPAPAAGDLLVLHAGLQVVRHHCGRLSPGINEQMKKLGSADRLCPLYACAKKTPAQKIPAPPTLPGCTIALV